MQIWNLMQSKKVRWSVAQCVTASLAAVAVPIAPANALFGGSANPYEVCTRDLTRAQVSTTDAANACAQALRPKDLGDCVDRIADEKISGADALSVCRQVRRPIEAGNCVVRIRRQASDTAIVDVLDSCRRSLLPERFAECVVGENRQLKISGKQAIDTCIDASDRPNDVLPTFIPAGSDIPGATTAPSITPTPIVPSPGQSSTPSTSTPASSTSTPASTSAPATTTPAPATSAPATSTPAPTRPVPALY